MSDQQVTLHAIKEMARVVKPGGAVAAWEITQYGDKPMVDFHPLFADADLNLVYTEQLNLGDGAASAVKYLYGKPT